MKQILHGILALCIISLSLSSCNSSTKAEANEEEIAKKSFLEKTVVKVGVEKVQRKSFDQELVSNGKLFAAEKAVVPFKLQEQIIAVNMRNGQRVKKGDVLVRLEAFKYQKQLNDSRNQYEKARIDLEDKLLGYGFTLEDSARVPANILKMAKIRSAYNQAQGNLKEAERNFAHTSVIAPISGLVANHELKANNSSGQYKKCCDLINDEVLQLEFSILEGEISQIKRGQSVEITPFANMNKSYKGIVTAVNPTIDEHGLIKVQARVNNINGELMDGMNARVLVKNEVPNCIVIPKTAVLYRQNKKVVFIHENGIAKWVYVTVGQENSTEVCITDNSLKPGQEIIVSNNLNLAHETSVSAISH